MKTKMKKLLTILIAITLMAGLAQAAPLNPTAQDFEDDVEAALGIDPITTYLDLTSDNAGDVPPGPYTREGLTLTTAGDTWNYPDDSDGDRFVNNNCLDEKSGSSNNDFLATISGLAPNLRYELYLVVAAEDSSTHDFSWGTSGDGSPVNTVDINSAPGSIDLVLGDGTPESRAIPLGEFTADGSGELATWIGKGQAWSDPDYRTQLDGFIVIPKSSDGKLSPSVDAGPDQVIVWPDDEVTLAASVQDDGDPNKVLKYWWKVTGQPAGSNVSLTNPTGLGPFTITVKSGGDVEPNQPDAVKPTVTVSQSGFYEVRLYARDEKSDSNDTVRILVYPTGFVEGLVGHWKLDDGIDPGPPTTLTAVDSSGSYVPNFTTYQFDHIFSHGTLNGDDDPGDPNWVDGVDYTDTLLLTDPTDFIGAIWLDSDDSQSDYEYINCGNASSFDLTDAISITAWIKVNQFDRAWQAIVTKGDQAWRLHRAQSGNVLEFAGQNLSPVFYVTGSVNVNDGKWHHVAGVYDGSSLSIYVDGVLDVSEAASGSIGTSTDDVMIGGNSDFATTDYRGWEGLIDDVRIFDFGLTREQILAVAGITNTAPEADAGDDRRLIRQPGDVTAIELDATVTDLPGNYDATWTVLSGPGTISFSLPGGNDKEDQLATMDDPGAYGLYHLQLTAEDTDNTELSDGIDDMYLMYQEKSQYSTNRDTPMGMWKLDESGTDPDAIDSSGNGFHGPRATTDLVDPNLPEWDAAGKIDGALKFANTGDDQIQYVDLSKVSGSDDLTVMLWVKPAIVEYMDPINKIPDDGSGAGWAIKLRDDGEIWFRIGSQDNRYNVESNSHRSK